MPENGVSDQGVDDNSSIGVFKPTSPPDLPEKPAEKPAEEPAEKPAEEPAEKPDTYFCLTCRADIEYGAEACPVCEKRLSWAELP